MRFQDHSRVEAAKDLLESWLVDVFDTTSDNCRRKLEECSDSGIFLLPHDVSPDAIRDWREKSLDCIRRGFERLFSVIRSLEEEATDSPADIAKNLTWEAIDKAFNWTEGDRNNSSKFKDWKTRAGVNSSVEVLEMLGASPGLDWEAPLVCDFRTRFDFLLNQLRNDAFSNTATAKPTNTHLEGVPQEYSTEGTGAGEKLKEQVAASNFLEFNGNLWDVRFGGGRERHIDDFVGVQYIALVLQQKLAEQRDLTPLELVNLRYGREEKPELENRDEVLPLLGAKTIKNRIDEIEDELGSSSDKDIDGLIDEKTVLQKHLASGRAKLPGADRPYRQTVFLTQSKRALDAVRKAIKEATARMTADEALVPLASHLDDNIKYGTTVSYDGSIAWTVEPGIFPRKKS